MFPVFMLILASCLRASVLYCLYTNMRVLLTLSSNLCKSVTYKSFILLSVIIPLIVSLIEGQIKNGLTSIAAAEVDGDYQGHREELFW